MLRTALIAVIILVPSLCLAQATKKTKDQTISFEDDTIQGDLSKPDGEFVETHKKAKHAALIRVREEFKDKVLQSVSDL
jgi:hypothetical protein